MEYKKIEKKKPLEVHGYLLFMLWCVGRSLSDGPITYPGKPYRLCVAMYVTVCVTLTDYTYNKIGRRSSTKMFLVLHLDI